MKSITYKYNSFTLLTISVKIICGMIFIIKNIHDTQTMSSIMYLNAVIHQVNNRFNLVSDQP